MARTAPALRKSFKSLVLTGIALALSVAVVPAALAADSGKVKGATSNGLNVKSYGAKGDGKTDDSAAITTAAKAAVKAGQRVYFPAGSYRIGTTMSAVAGAYYYAPTGVTLQSAAAVNGANNVTFDGFTFAAYGSTIAIRIGSTTATAPVTGMKVKNCRFVAGSGEYTWTRILTYWATDCVIDRNTFTGTAGSGGNIQILAGKRNQITNNTITGGTTAIIFMWSRPTAAGNGSASIIEDNTISGNVCSGYSEEGISFDLQANSATGCGAFEYDTVKAVSGQTVTLTTATFPSYTGYDVIVVDGALAGRTRTITAQSSNAFTVSGSLAGLAVGDHVTIGAPFKHNVVTGNTCTARDKTDASILLYGLCFGNTVTGNTVAAGTVKVQSLDNTPVITGSATKSFGRAPCGFNTVQGNNVSDSSSRVYLEYWSVAKGSYSTPFVTVGNNVTGNTTPQVSALNQSSFINGNSGTTSFNNVTLAAAAFSYDDGR